jgi:hypothetical protein
MAALGYDSAMLLADAIKRAGSTDGPKCATRWRRRRIFRGSREILQLTTHRDAKKPLVILQVKGGKFNLVEKIAPNNRPCPGMIEFLQQLINGLSLGAVYALIALGYTMVYGILRFINFAHSDVFMVGSVCGFYCSRLDFGRIRWLADCW